VGSRPGLTPRHSGTIWTTYKVTQQWRLGGGLTAKSGDKPVGLAAGSPIVAPRYVTADLLAEYTQGDLSFKLNVINVTNKHHADLVYRGHYVPGKARTVQWTTSYRF
jgi:catecholate siderophore receptor